MPNGTPEQNRRWNAAAQARAAEREAVRLTAQRAAMADYQPVDVRTYGRSPSGLDWDAAIQAAAYWTAPGDRGPNPRGRGVER